MTEALTTEQLAELRERATRAQDPSWYPPERLAFFYGRDMPVLLNEIARLQQEYDRLLVLVASYAGARETE